MVVVEPLRGRRRRRTLHALVLLTYVAPDSRVEGEALRIELGVSRRAFRHVVREARAILVPLGHDLVIERERVHDYERRTWSWRTTYSATASLDRVVRELAEFRP